MDRVTAKAGSARPSGTRTTGMEQGDGRVVFAHIRRYLLNDFIKVYVYHVAMRLDDLATNRRLRVYKTTIEQKVSTAAEEQELREGWKDEASPEHVDR